jgi:hypothetical protein
MIGRALNSPGDVAMRRFKLFGTNERKIGPASCMSLKSGHGFEGTTCIKIESRRSDPGQKARIQSVEDVLKTAACAAADCR